MRLWSIHPQYLDAKGLVAAWREGLLAQKVLRGETRGYRNHPQLARFRQTADPPGTMAAWLAAVCDEAERRGYNFDRSRIGTPSAETITVADGQIAYEWAHLLAKLARRDPARWERLREGVIPQPHPLFVIAPGDVEPWEVIRDRD